MIDDAWSMIVGGCIMYCTSDALGIVRLHCVEFRGILNHIRTEGGRFG